MNTHIELVLQMEQQSQFENNNFANTQQNQSLFQYYQNEPYVKIIIPFIYIFCRIYFTSHLTFNYSSIHAYMFYLYILFRNVLTSLTLDF
ncbi:unnamed protein product [Leptidea sinapis]|uniref:Transmembrane protein n=1 Tax=Leptidea sinapis TaxID=189913 RepID=A0A5E4PZK3_9NEOP|nr:unnamed protein product [Leptidea sinapis]